ncbi:MAG: hypothetical protein E3J72_00330 [Planctomycetota bacterium]|nr:MAG: hypothetical protein E3J72_00330 [Planctomycetota bacterium]
MKTPIIYFFLFCLGAAALLPGCGAGGAGIVAALMGDDDDDKDLFFVPATISITTPTGSPIEYDVAVQFNLVHPNSMNSSVTAEYYDPDGPGWFSAALSSSATEGTAKLATSPGGVLHVFLWDSLADLGSGIHDRVRFRIRPLGGTAATTSEFIVDNTSPPVLSITGFTPVVQEYGDIWVGFTVSDAEGDNVSVQVRYSLDNGATFPITQPANRAAGLGNSMYGLQTDPAGRVYVFAWDSRSNLGDTFNGEVALQFVPADSKGGAPAVTVPFIVNNTTPSIYPSGPASIISGSVPIDFIAVDSHSDNVDVVVEYTTNGGLDWFPATSVADPSGYITAGTNNLQSTPSGFPNVFYWNSFYDLSSIPAAVIFRLQPIELPTGAPGAWTWTVGFPVNNQYMSTVVNSAAAGSINAVAANMKSPIQIRANPSERLYILDPGENRLRAVNITAMPLDILGVPTRAGQIVTVAGTGGRGIPEDGIPAVHCGFLGLVSVELHPDNAVHAVYLADRALGQVYYVDEGGILTIVAGAGQPGPTEEGAIARYTRFQNITDIAVDGNMNLYIACDGPHVVWRVDAASGTVKLFAGSLSASGFSGDSFSAAGALLNRPARIAIDYNDNVYILDKGNQRIRMVNNQAGVINPFGIGIISGAIETICGNAFDGSVGATDGLLDDEGADGGDGLHPRDAYLNNPDGFAVTGPPLMIYVADSMNRRFRALNPNAIAVNVGNVPIAPDTINTFAGKVTAAPNTGDDAQATEAGFGYPVSVARAEDGTVYLADLDGKRVRSTDNSGIIRAFAGGVFDTGEVVPASVTRLDGPEGLAFGPDGDLYIADTGNHRVVKLNLATQTISMVAGDGTYDPAMPIADGVPATTVMLNQPAAVAFDCAGNLYIADRGENLIRVVNLTAAPINLSGTTIDPGDIRTIAGNGSPSFEPAGPPQAPLGVAVQFPTAITVDSRGLVYIATGNNLRLLNPTETDCNLVAGALPVPAKTIQLISGMEDSGTIDDALLPLAEYNSPGGIVVNDQDHLYIADGNGPIRIANLSADPLVLPMSSCGSFTVLPGMVKRYAGAFSGAGISGGDGLPAIHPNVEIISPAHLSLDSTGNVLFVERGNLSLRRIRTGDGIIHTLAGNGMYPPDVDSVPPEQASLADPVGIALDPLGFIYFSESESNKIRRFYAGP